MRLAAVLIASIGILLASGCSHMPESISNAENPLPAVSFTDVTKKSGIDFKHYSGAQGKKYMPETVGSGVAFLDYNNDGKLDILYVNSTDWPDSPQPKPHYPALYRNNGDGTFTDVTEQAGLKIDVYGMGAAVGDFDNDGYPDIYLTCIGPNHLFHNNHNGTFTDVTAKAGVAGVPVEPGGIRFKWSSSAAWCDYDKDGIPDLFVCNYVKWTPKTDVLCRSRGGLKAYCAPNNYEGVACTLYHGKKDGTFEDVSERMGINRFIGKSLGVVVADFNGDGWPDIAVTNDTSRNFLFFNEGGKRFREAGELANFAYPESGSAKAGMGIDAAYFNNDGHLGLLTGNFSKECLSLYENDGTGLFRDQNYSKGIAEPSLQFLTFGLFFFDYDLDGKQDILTANGHIDDYVHESDAMITYKERPLLFHNGGEKFAEVGMTAGPAMQTLVVGRGCAWGDWNLDGHPGVALVSNNDAGYLWQNNVSGRHWIGLKLQGAKSTRDGWGALIHVSAAGKTQTFQVFGGGSFLSSRQIEPLVGLGNSNICDKLTIDWPSGIKTDITNLTADKYYTIEEGQPQPLR